jgi:hypothetical protein|tara:strand:- start:38 stop:271 length:234 start_codon:yes stop_codon:yes gene_type:complete
MKELLKDTIILAASPFLCIGGLALLFSVMCLPMVILGFLDYNNILNPNVNQVGPIFAMINIFWLGFLGALTNRTLND